MAMDVAEPLNLLHLARAAADEPVLVPGTDLTVRRVLGHRHETTTAPSWCLVLAGELIIDLPQGAFRILTVGDALHLPAGLELKLQSVSGEVLLAWRSLPPT